MDGRGPGELDAGGSSEIEGRWWIVGLMAGFQNGGVAEACWRRPPPCWTPPAIALDFFFGWEIFL